MVFGRDDKNNQNKVIKNWYEEKPQYAIIKLEFLDANDFNRTLETAANSNGLMIDARTFREYFGIAYAENLGNILRQFCVYFGNFIPTEVGDNKDDKSLSFCYSEDCTLEKSDEDIMKNLGTIYLTANAYLIFPSFRPSSRNPSVRSGLRVKPAMTSGWQLSI